MAETNTMYNPHDFEIKIARIVWATGETLDIRPSIVEFNYFEDIFANQCSGYVMLNDSLNLDNKHSFNGNEYFIFSLQKKTVGLGIRSEEHTSELQSH